MSTSWFADLFGFSESAYDETKKRLDVVGTTLRSKVNQRSYAIGTLSTPSVRELREAAAPLLTALRGTLKVSNISGDVRRIHANPAHRHALFQVASQFNLLEMTGPDVTPEHGVTRYADDRTQAPHMRAGGRHCEIAVLAAAGEAGLADAENYRPSLTSSVSMTSAISKSG